MASLPIKQVKYSQMFAANGATTVAVSSSGTTITLNVWPSGLTATNYSGYKIWFSPNEATSQTANLVGANPTTKKITISAPFTVASSQAVWVGIPTSPTAGMSKLYLRSAVTINAGAPLRFGLSGRKFKVSIANATASNIINFSPAIPSPVPSDLATTGSLLIGGIDGSPSINDTLAFAEQVSRSAVANANSIALAQTVVAYKQVPRTTTDSLVFTQTVTPVGTYTRSVSDTITLAQATQGTAKKQYIYTYDALHFAENVNAGRFVQNFTTDTLSFSDKTDTPLFSFTTPLAKIVPPYLPETRGLAYKLFRHYEVTNAHVNVYELQDGTFVQNYPTPENGNTNIPYPWNPSDPTAPYATVTNWNGTIERFYLPNPIIRVFYGGETTMVTQQEANKLRQAGYGAYIGI